MNGEVRSSLTGAYKVTKKEKLKVKVFYISSM